MLRSLVCCSLIVLAAACNGGNGSGSAASTPATQGGGRLALEPVATGLDSPVDVAAVPGTSDLAVVEKSGRLLVLRDGRPLPRPLLDLRGKVSTGSEQGLLSVAFDPRYERTHLAYVDYTDLAGDTHIARLDTTTGRLTTLLFVNQPYANHNGGGLAFGPDGLLYVGMGDGGSEGDPQGNGQNRGALLAKILRLDVHRQGGAPERYAYGVRNPWRIAFDSQSGDLWIGDVGQNRWEEIDRLPAGTPPGSNLGWNAYEAREPYHGQPADRSRLVWPVAAYSHDVGCSVTGGVVVRGGPVRQLRGAYVYGDFCSGRLWALHAQGGRPRSLAVPSLQGVDAFAQDASGSLLAVTLGGRVVRFVTRR
ncbi:MAG TPA: PQQ-dependent sugar dehydrogenase [Gaiellales bacterium]